MTEAIEFKTNDNLHLHGQIWRPDAKPAGVICLIHGFGEHINRYHHVAAAANKENLALAAIDLRGHGKSAGKRGHTPSYNHLLEDLQMLLDGVSKAFPDTPVFLYGHSMGGNIASSFLLRNKNNNIKAAVITSPWIKLKFDPPKVKIALGRLMRKIYPTYSEANGLDPDQLSRDTAVGKAYEADPLVINKITTEMYFSIVEAGEWALNHATPTATPLLIMHGSADAITSPEASKQMAEKMNAEYKTWEGMYHETHNEIGNEEVIATIIDWFIKHLK